MVARQRAWFMVQVRRERIEACPRTTISARARPVRARKADVLSLGDAATKATVVPAGRPSLTNRHLDGAGGDRASGVPTEKGMSAKRKEESHAPLGIGDFTLAPV